MSEQDDKAAIEAAVGKLETQFTRWKNEVIRLLKAPVTFAKKVGDTHRLGGSSLTDMLAIVRGWIADHVAADNPHKTTAAMIDAYKTSEVDVRVANYFPRSGLRLTKLPAMAATVSGNTLTAPARLASHGGYGFTIPALTMALAGTAAQYLVVTLGMNGMVPTGTFSISTDPDLESKNPMSIIVGTITNTNGTYAFTGEGDVVRIGTHRISLKPYGDGIPAAPGTPATPGTVDPTWFN